MHRLPLTYLKLYYGQYGTENGMNYQMIIRIKIKTLDSLLLENCRMNKLVEEWRSLTVFERRRPYGKKRWFVT